MEIVPAVGEAEKLATELLVLGVFRDGPLLGSARAVNDRSAGRLAAILDQTGFGETVGATCLNRRCDLPDRKAPRCRRAASSVGRPWPSRTIFR